MPSSVTVFVSLRVGESWEILIVRSRAMSAWASPWAWAWWRSWAVECSAAVKAVKTPIAAIVMIIALTITSIRTLPSSPEAGTLLTWFGRYLLFI